MKIYDSIVIGAGPAGITAGIYLARRKLKVLVFYREVGGQASKTSDIENYSGFKFITGRDFTEKLKEHIKSYDLQCNQEKVIKIKKSGKIFNVKTKKSEYFSKSIIYATGAKQKKLNIKGEEEFLNKGVAYCATCDAPLFNKKDVAIIGGGNSALEATLQLEKYAKKLYIITINKKLDGEKILQEKVMKLKNVKHICCSSILEIKGKKFVESIRIKQQDKEKEIPVQGVFVEIGYEPNSELINVEKNNLNEIKIDSKNQTSKKGIFAAGDVTNIPVKQIIVASGEGAKAAISAAEYLSRMKN